jgi:hypothetical protein
MGSFGGFLPVAVACNERLLRVDCGHPYDVRKSSAVGGEPTFTDAMVNGEVAS